MKFSIRHDHLSLVSLNMCFAKAVVVVVVVVVVVKQEENSLIPNQIWSYLSSEIGMSLCMYNRVLRSFIYMYINI